MLTVTGPSLRAGCGLMVGVRGPEPKLWNKIKIGGAFVCWVRQLNGNLFVTCTHFVLQSGIIGTPL